MKSTMKAAGLILAAVVLGLMTVQGTYALWNATATYAPGTVQAADFNILVSEAQSTKYAMATTPSLSFDVGEVKKNVPVYKAVTVENAVNVTADSPLAVRAGLTVQPVQDNLGGNLSVQVASLGAAPRCDSAGVAYANTLPAPLDLPWKTARTVCIKVSLGPNTPAARMGKPITINANLSVAQVAPGTK